MTAHLISSAVALLALAGSLPGTRTGEPVQFAAADKVRVFVDDAGAGDSARPLILAFNMAGSNRFEYAPIVPRLNALGYEVLAVDQRSGGTLWGHANETVRVLGRQAGYIDALADLEAALAWARQSGHTGRIIVWGSSYSASLVFLLAAKHPNEIAAMLAFSPGEYLANRNAVHAAAAEITMPVFVTSASDAKEVADARSILAATAGGQKVQHIAKHGVHGSSTLRPDVNPTGAEDVWQAVESFLAGLK